MRETRRARRSGYHTGAPRDSDAAINVGNCYMPMDDVGKAVETRAPAREGAGDRPIRSVGTGASWPRTASAPSAIIVWVPRSTRAATSTARRPLPLQILSSFRGARRAAGPSNNTDSQAGPREDGRHASQREPPTDSEARARKRPIQSDARLDRKITDRKTESTGNLVPLVPDIGQYELSFIHTGETNYVRQYRIFATNSDNVYRRSPFASNPLLTATPGARVLRWPARPRQRS